MTLGAAERWRMCARVSTAMGTLGCIVMAGSLLFLIAYYSANRPHNPQPHRGWTVALSWTHPTSYGTAREQDRLWWLHFLFIPSFVLVLLGPAIKAYKLNDYSEYDRGPV
jgi:hypothetical protein